MRWVSSVFAVVVTLCLGCWRAPFAAAEFGPIELVSKSSVEQASAAEEPALSADGRYIAFRATLGGVAGIYRKDLQSGELALVAPSPASAPSISADGRYVSFTTTAKLDPVDDQAASSSDVYVRDMDVPAPPSGKACEATEPCPYELASALDGSSVGLAYASNEGSVAAGRVALSADGREVAFATRAASNLTGPSISSTPAGQVVLRKLDSRETTLVSVERDPVTGAMQPGKPVPGGALLKPASSYPRAGPSLSADGSTVAWLGVHLPAQVPLLAEERATIEAKEDRTEWIYDEPLWRRVADDPLAPTRRIVGGGDSLAPYPQLFEKKERIDNPLEGWVGLTNVGGAVDGAPQLSADGFTVALIGNPDEGADVFVVDMHPGLTRDQAIHRLTHWTPSGESPVDPQLGVNEKGFIPLGGNIWDLAISPDGSHVAFTTARQYFPLSPPVLITPQPAGLGQTEVYQADLDTGTLERVTPGPGRDVSLGTPVEMESNPGVNNQANSPSYSADGRLLAFASGASNLVAGDANEAADVFVVESRPGTPPAGNAISPQPPASIPRPSWRLIASAVSLPNGSVRIRAVVPGAGMLRAVARAQLGDHLVMHRVAAGRGHTGIAGPVSFTLRLSSARRRLARKRGGLYATVRIAFRGPGGKSLHEELQARFRVHRRAGGRGA